MSMAMQQLKS